jgi:hypothetical protein
MACTNRPRFEPRRNRDENADRVASPRPRYPGDCHTSGGHLFGEERVSVPRRDPLLRVPDSLASEDSSGQSGFIGVGELQHMTAGRAVRYSETNASQNVHEGSTRAY